VNKGTYYNVKHKYSVTVKYGSWSKNMLFIVVNFPTILASHIIKRRDVRRHVERIWRQEVVADVLKELSKITKIVMGVRVPTEIRTKRQPARFLSAVFENPVTIVNMRTTELWNVLTAQFVVVCLGYVSVSYVVNTYTVSQERRSVFSEVTVSVILSMFYSERFPG
jgi:hypothetical protein